MENPLEISNFWEIIALSKENPLKRSEFLENKNVFNKISPSFVLFRENDDWMKANCLNFRKIRTFFYGKSPSFARILEK
jgi:hypothetical protein